MKIAPVVTARGVPSLKALLESSLWTTDVEVALRIGDQVDTGTWYMNRCDYLDPALAWAGVKDSGRGCTLSKLGFEAFTRPKSFHLRLNL